MSSLFLICALNLASMSREELKSIGIPATTIAEFQDEDQDDFSDLDIPKNDEVIVKPKAKKQKLLPFCKISNGECVRVKDKACFCK